jgi:xanthine dehydrogenase accessory factor
VVSRRSPVSSHIGDRAIIHQDGHMDGFVGGACSREIVRRQALDALAARAPRLVQIRPDGAPADFTPNANHVVVPMSCASEGAADVYIEPYMRAPLLLIAGFSPVAEALARVALALEWECVRLVSAEEVVDLAPGSSQVVTLDGLDAYLAALAAAGRPIEAGVVASQGHYDELALEKLLHLRPHYLGLVASRKRGALVRDVLRDRGADADVLATIHNPAGLAVGAISPGEVAISILAQIVQRRHEAGDAGLTLAAAEAMAPRMATDPVCQMEVEIAAARHTAEYEGATYYFCCPHCKRSFEKDPARYLAAAGSA